MSREAIKSLYDNDRAAPAPSGTSRPFTVLGVHHVAIGGLTRRA